MFLPICQLMASCRVRCRLESQNMKAKGWAGGIKSLVSLVDEVKRLLIRGKLLLARPMSMCMCMGVRPESVLLLRCTPSMQGRASSID